MQKSIGLFILTFFLTTSCFTVIEPEPLIGFKVHTYYVVPSDKSYSDDNANRVGRAIFEMQRWYQAATGGLTFEMLDQENIIEVYFTNGSSSSYQDDWWSLLLTEMKNKGHSINEPGVVSILWVEGLGQVSSTATAQGGNGCDGTCGSAILPMHTIIAQTWPPADMGLPFHEMGHALGLHHPVEESDLPLTAEDMPLLYSVMCQTEIRAGKTNNEHGFLTSEKAQLTASKFMKKDIVLYQDFWNTNIINYPVTGPVPDPAINFQTSGRTVSFSSNIIGAKLYYWYFSDGSISNEESPTHEFDLAGLYYVTLMVTDHNNMAARVSQYVQLQ